MIVINTQVMQETNTDNKKKIVTDFSEMTKMEQQFFLSGNKSSYEKLLEEKKQQIII